MPVEQGIKPGLRQPAKGHYAFRPLFRNGEVATSTTARTDVGGYNWSNDPSTDWGQRTGGGTSTADRALIMGLEETESIAFKFYGGDADNDTASIRMWGIDQLVGDTFASTGLGLPPKTNKLEYIASHACDLSITFGSATLGASEIIGVLPSESSANQTAFLADTITISPNELWSHPTTSQTLSNTAESWATMIICTQGYCGFIIEIDRADTAVWCAGIWRPV